MSRDKVLPDEYEQKMLDSLEKIWYRGYNSVTKTFASSAIPTNKSKLTKQGWQRKWGDMVSLCARALEYKDEAERRAEQVGIYRDLFENQESPKIEGSRFGAKRQEYKERSRFVQRWALFRKRGICESRGPEKEAPGAFQSDPSSTLSLTVVPDRVFFVFLRIFVFDAKTLKL